MDNKKQGQTKPYSGHGDVDHHGPYQSCTLRNGFPSVDTLPVVTVPGTNCTDGRWVSQAHEPELPKIPMLIFFGRTERKAILFFFTHICAAMTPYVSRTYCNGRTL